MPQSLIPATPENPISWFESLIVYSSSELLHQDFKMEAEKSGGYFMPAHPYTGLNDESVYYVDREENNEMNMVGFSFVEYCRKKLSDEYGLAAYNFDKRIGMMIDLEEKERFIQEKVELIQSLKQIANKKVRLKELTNLSEVLNELQNHFRSIPDVVLTKEEIVSNIFGFKKGTKAMSKLYEGLVEIGFFDEDDNQEEYFKEVLKSFNPDSGIKLRIACDNQFAAYTLERMQSLFYKLNPTTIAGSGLFLTKHGTPFDLNGINSAASKFRAKLKKKPGLSQPIDNLINTISQFKG